MGALLSKDSPTRMALSPGGTGPLLEPHRASCNHVRLVKKTEHEPDWLLEDSILRKVRGSKAKSSINNASFVEHALRGIAALRLNGASSLNWPAAPLST